MNRGVEEHNLVYKKCHWENFQHWREEYLKGMVKANCFMQQRVIFL